MKRKFVLDAACRSSWFELCTFTLKLGKLATVTGMQYRIV